MINIHVKSNKISTNGTQRFLLVIDIIDISGIIAVLFRNDGQINHLFKIMKI
jgi:hypothetical protein